jgi:hypothetical protein
MFAFLRSTGEHVGFEHEGTLKSERCDPDGTRRTMRVYATTR